MNKKIPFPYEEFEGTVQARAFVLDENKKHVPTLEAYCKSINIAYQIKYEQDYDVI